MEELLYFPLAHNPYKRLKTLKSHPRALIGFEVQRRTCLKARAREGVEEKKEFNFTNLILILFFHFFTFYFQYILFLLSSFMYMCIYFFFNFSK